MTRKGGVEIYSIDVFHPKRNPTLGTIEQPIEIPMMVWELPLVLKVGLRPPPKKKVGVNYCNAALGCGPLHWTMDLF